jgi:hypothetical protein
MVHKSLPVCSHASPLSHTNFYKRCNVSLRWSGCTQWEVFATSSSFVDPDPPSCHSICSWKRTVTLVIGNRCYPFTLAGVVAVEAGSVLCSLLKGWGAAMLLVVSAGVSQNRFCAATTRFYKFRNYRYRKFHNFNTLLMTCVILYRIWGFRGIERIHTAFCRGLTLGSV